ncbi:MAG: AAA family ATPase [Candidatus Paceibacterota bacterium]|jgi:predicted ATPase
MEQKYPQGAVWRKWDLHLHTPSSEDYENMSIGNDDIINTLSNNNIQCAAITDHHNIDCSRITELQKLGKEKNITILPGIEFLSDARGDEPVHFIGIFSENCDINYVWAQIENNTKIKDVKGKKKKRNEIYCDLEETVKFIKELGGIVTIHAGKKSNSIENITNALPHGMAQKEDIAKIIDFFELGKESDVNEYKMIVIKYLKKAINKEHPMILCSDNHNAADYKLKQNCWIKADPTFEGLKQVINEPDRVFIGDMPEILSKVSLNKTKFIRKIEIKPVKGYSQKQGKWFENDEIKLNKELVGIIGNKGSGKSALADIIALSSFYKDDKNFSFLTPKKFREKNLAQNFESTITWEDETPNNVNLNRSFKEEDGVLERVKYLPQGYFEDLCNEFESLNKFKNELENVVFQHLPDDEKYSKNTFEELIEYRKRTVDKEISIIQSELNELNKTIIGYEKKENKRYFEEIKLKLEQKDAELKALKEPAKIDDPNKDDEIAKQNKVILEKINQIKKEIEDLLQSIEKNKERKTDLINEVAELNNIKDDITIVINELKAVKEKHKINLNEKYKISIDDIIKVEANFKLIDDLTKQKEKEIDAIKILLGEKILKIEEFDVKKDNKTLVEKLQLKKKELEVEQNKLDEPQKKYQKYLEEIQIFEKQKKEIIGDETKYDSRTWLEKEKKFIETGLQQKISELHVKRLNMVEQIFIKKSTILKIYHTVKRSIDEIIEQNNYLLKGYEINIDASLNIKHNFEKTFFDYINQGVRGSFYGTSDGSFRLKEILNQKDIESKDDILKLLNEIIEHLKFDKRKNSNNEKVFIGTQISDLEGFYNYLFSLVYIDYNYELKLGDKKLESLSPGEKGALLLVFYLLLDKSDIPLILDQPEDNLDNNSVATILVPFIKEAKKKRQIIMVTHNPNLAVVADAEQIIYVNIDKNDGNKFSFISGSIEDKIINERIVSVLEGAMPAFNQRKKKYYE